MPTDPQSLLDGSEVPARGLISDESLPSPDTTWRGIVRTNASRVTDEARWRRASVRELRAPSVPLTHTTRATQAEVPDSVPLPIPLQRHFSGEGPPTSAPRPNRVVDWAHISSYELRDDGLRITGRWLRGWPKLREYLAKSQGWILAIAIGVCTCLSGFAIEVVSNHLASPRFGYCSGNHFTTFRDCGQSHWKDWDGGLGAFSANVGLGVVMAAASAAMVQYFAKAAAGSGIPEVKTILNGFVMPDVVSTRTLLVKMPGLALAVAAGMALGKEGPLVHVGVCWAQLLSGFSSQFSNEARRRELISAASSAGVSTAFGAPLGGVLFSLEEVSTIFPPRTLIRCFTCAVSAALVLSLIRGAQPSQSQQGLTMFSVEYNQPAHAAEHVVFALIGVFGGLVGAAFNQANVIWSAYRMRPAFRSRVSGVMEVSLIALVTLITSWPSSFLRLLSTDVIHALFESCGDGSQHELRTYIGLCSTDDQGNPEFAPVTAGLVFTLLFAGFVRLFQMTITFGTLCPAGLFVPSLFVGACFGRCVGVLMQHWNTDTHFLGKGHIEPGVYAMVGAAAVLGGVCRVTISLVAIMLELTGGMTYIVPFMLAVLIAKIVGDAINEGIYDLYILLKGYPFLQEEVSITFDERCCDIMETQLITLDIGQKPSYLGIRRMLDSYGYRGFPVVDGSHFIGYVKRSRLEALLERVLGPNVSLNPTTAAPDIQLMMDGEASASPHFPEGTASNQLAPAPGPMPPNLTPFSSAAAQEPVATSDLMSIVDTTVMRMARDASLSQAHRVFKQLGVKYIFLVSAQDNLQGMLSKKKFVLALKTGRVGHMSREERGPSREEQSPSRRDDHGRWVQNVARERRQFEEAQQRARALGLPLPRPGQQNSYQASPEQSDEEEEAMSPRASDDSSRR